MEGYKTLFTDVSGIGLLNMGSSFWAWDESMQADDEYGVGTGTYKVFVPEGDYQFIELGTYEVTNTAHVIVEMDIEEVER